MIAKKSLIKVFFSNQNKICLKLFDNKKIFGSFNNYFHTSQRNYSQNIRNPYGKIFSKKISKNNKRMKLYNL